MKRVTLARVLRRSWFIVLTLAPCALGQRVAFAQVTETADEADLQFQLGSERYDAGDIKGALERFLASNRLAPNKNVLFNIARCYEQLKLLPEAYRYYSASLNLEPEPAGKRRATEALDRLKARVALLTIESDPPGATIYLDRVDLGSRGVTPRTLALPEGSHAVLLQLPNFEQASSGKLELVVGQETHTSIKLKPI